MALMERDRSFRENIDSSDALGGTITVIVGAVAKLDTAALVAP